MVGTGAALMVTSAGQFADWLTTTAFMRQWDNEYKWYATTPEDNPLVEGLFTEDSDDSPGLDMDLGGGAAKFAGMKLGVVAITAASIAFQEWGKDRGGMTERVATAGFVDGRDAATISGVVMLLVAANNARHIASFADERDKGVLETLF